MDYDYTILNGKIATPNELISANIGINDGKISVISTHNLKAEEIIDATKKIIFPGIIDTHVHFQLQGPGTQKTSDKFVDGTRAALFGGVTTILDFADQYPRSNMTPTQAVSNRLEQITSSGSFVDYGLHLNLTDSKEDTLKEIPKIINQGIPSFKLFMIGKDTGLFLDDEDLINILTTISSHPHGYAVVHAENNSMFEFNLKKQLEMNELSPINHARSRPAEVEYEAVNRIIQIARNTGCRIHIFHVSTWEATKLVHNAQCEGLPVTGETCPHYLEWTEQLYLENRGNLYLMSPPLRTEENKEKLWESLKNNWIQQIVTDHCTYSLAQKGNENMPFTQIAKGIDGVETLLPIIYDRAVNKRNFHPTKLVSWLSYYPAKIHRIQNKGLIFPGYDADLVIFNPNEEKIINTDLLHGKDFTAWEGIKVKGWVDTVIKNGKKMIEYGSIIEEKPLGKFIKR
ncbi:MAG: dihydroorotase family protein [Candidatus Thorarchaeota archaeon]